MSPVLRDESPLGVVQLTPVGSGALACLRVTGRGADELVAARFSPLGRVPFGERPLRRLQFGRWKLPAGDRHEEVVVNRLAIDAAEIACHGGPAVTAALLADLVSAGAQPLAEPTPVLYGTLSGDARSSAISQAAQAALAEARTSAAAAVLLDQSQGALAQAFDEIDAEIVAGRRVEGLRKIETLLSRAPLGLHLVRPWRVAVVGRPNVGKSRLINALLGYERAIVHAEAGTTRDVVSAATAFGGWPVEISDTAGMRETTDEIESAGVSLSLSQLAAADLALVVWDGSRLPNDDDERLLIARPDALLVVNKSDLTAAFDPPARAVRISAATGDGIAELADRIGARFVPEPPPAGAAVPFTPTQVAELEALREALPRAETPRL